MVQYSFTSTETRRLVRTVAQDGHLDSSTAPELWLASCDPRSLFILEVCALQIFAVTVNGNGRWNDETSWLEVCNNKRATARGSSVFLSFFLFLMVCMRGSWCHLIFFSHSLYIFLWRWNQITCKRLNDVYTHTQKKEKNCDIDRATYRVQQHKDNVQMQYSSRKWQSSLLSLKGSSL